MTAKEFIPYLIVAAIVIGAVMLSINALALDVAETLDGISDRTCSYGCYVKD